MSHQNHSRGEVLRAAEAEHFRFRLLRTARGRFRVEAYNDELPRAVHWEYLNQRLADRKFDNLLEIFNGYEL